MAMLPQPITDFQGMNQRQDYDKIPDNFSPLLINISNDKPGTWAKRKGINRLSVTDSGSGIYALFDYEDNTGAHTIRAIKSKNLFTYNETTDTYTNIGTNVFPSEQQVSMVKFNNRVYSISPSDFLRYETGGSLTEVGTGDNRIMAKSLVTAQNTLFVAGVTAIGTTSYDYQDRVYYSLFRGSTEATDQLYEDSTTLLTSTRWFTLQSPHKASFAYGATGLSYHFTEKNCFSFDIRGASNATSVQSVFNKGCCSPRAITECNGWMIWMDMEARIWAWGGAGNPIPLSWDIEDDANKSSILSKLTKSALNNVCAGSIGNKFYFSIGDVEFFGETLRNVVIKGLITQTLDHVIWGIDTYPVRPVVFSNGEMGGQQVLLFGAAGVDDVFIMNSGINDAETPISARAKTKFFAFGSPFATKEGSRLYIKYRPQSVQNTYLGIKYAIDGRFVYSPLSDPDGSSGATQYGIIDMYESNFNNALDDVKYINLPQEIRFRTLSIEVGNDQLNESFEVSGMAFALSGLKDLDIRSESV